MNMMKVQWCPVDHFFDGVEKDSKMDENDDLVSILSQESEKWYVMNICHGCVSVCYNLYVCIRFFIKSFKTYELCIVYNLYIVGSIICWWS